MGWFLEEASPNLVGPEGLNFPHQGVFLFGGGGVGSWEEFHKTICQTEQVCDYRRPKAN